MKKIYRQIVLIFLICCGLTLWGIIMHNRLINNPQLDSDSNGENPGFWGGGMVSRLKKSYRDQKQPQFDIKLTSRERTSLTNQLSALEIEIQHQKQSSQILLNKIRMKYAHNNEHNQDQPGGPRPNSIIVTNLESSVKTYAQNIQANEEQLKSLRNQLGLEVLNDGDAGEMKSLEELDNETNHHQENQINHKAKVPNHDDGDGGAHEIIDNENSGGSSRENVIAILVFVCNRPSITRCLDTLLQYRPSATQFPIVVSQDCGNSSIMSNALQPYERNIQHIWQPDLSHIPVPPRDTKYEGYYKISRHYGWALNHTFYTLKYSNVVIVEDDLLIAPDFFEYFSATLPLLRKDPSLFCVSAWNDNGKAKRIDSSASELLYRTDFFPGLGWMMTKQLWDELSPKWPKGFWDDWMREPAQRRNRACIRPEISRTSTFGKDGVSQGTYYLNHLRYIELNSKFVQFTKMDLSYLIKDTYDKSYLNRVYAAEPVKSIAELTRLTKEAESPHSEYRLTYRSKDNFRTLALKLELMEDLRAGVPRTAYRGIVPLMFNSHRVYLAPGANWVGYQP